MQGVVPWRSRTSDDPFAAMQAVLNNALADFPRLETLAPTIGANGWLPRVDVTEDEKSIEVSCELPGVDEKQIDVSLMGSTLTIKGEKTAEKEERKKNWYRMERSYGSFQRQVALPCDVDQERVSAAFKNGVITVTLPKSVEEQRKARKIAVKT